MSELLFLGGCAVLLAGLLAWGFKFLPGERWQMLAVVPLHKHADNSWHGANLTYYGFFIATSQLFAVMLMLVLLGSLGIPLRAIVLPTTLLLLVCIPASRVVAMLVERKRHTFTIGGAAFIGIVLAPWTIIASSRLLTPPGGTETLPVIPILAAMSLGYTLGEGLGRLGCISFGCCYGKPLHQCGPVLQKIFHRLGFCFSGSTKKAVYEGQLEGQPLVPIQAVTAVIYTITALAGSSLFLHGRFTATLLFSIAATQGWRILSETLRADFRGFAKISAYQKMGFVSIVYMAVIASLLPSVSLPTPSLNAGIASLWHPGLILGLQIMWLFLFCFFGRSTITTAQVNFELLRERL